MAEKNLSLSRYRVFVRSVVADFFVISKRLLAIMVPIILFVKFLEEVGVVGYVGGALAPAMSLIGLPAEMGIVWASAMISNIYGGLIMLMSLPEVALNVQQATTLGGIMLVSHGLILEGAVASRVGVKFYFHGALRVLTAYIFGLINFWMYSALGSGNGLAEIRWRPSRPESASLFDWSVQQIENLAYVELIIFVLIIAIRILELLGINSVLERVMSPLLRLLGLSPRTAPIVTVGVTMGLAYGGGLLMKETERGVLSRRDIFVAVCFISIFHGVIEDTLAVLLLGGDFAPLLWTRLVLSVFVTFVISKAVDSVEPRFAFRFFYSR